MKNNEIEKLINPYAKEKKTYFSLKEESLKKKRASMSNTEVLNFKTDLRQKNKAERITKKKIKKIKAKKIKIKKEKFVKVKEDKTKIIFKMIDFSWKQRLIVSVILISTAIIFASFIDSYNFKFVIFYNNGIDLNNGFSTAVMYLSILGFVMYNGYCLIKSRRIIIKDDGLILIKSYTGDVKDYVWNIDIRFAEHENMFDLHTGDALVKSIPNKYLDKLKVAIEQKPINTEKMV